MSTQYLDASALPPFEPTKNVVYCANGPMPALMWAFSSCVPPMARMIFSGNDGASNASLRMNATPAMQWNYSMLHLAHHYEAKPQRWKKFVVNNEENTLSILLEITSLRACPDDVEDVNVLPQSEFVDPLDGEKRSLGALPIFFVRYLHEERSDTQSWSDEALKFLNNAIENDGGVCEITAASVEEINFGLKELQRGQSLRGETTKNGKFNESVLFPTQIKKTKSHGKAPYVCAACDTVISDAKPKSCARCKVTYYCNRECQVLHWKSGGHKEACRKLPTQGGKETGSRKSIVFDIEDATPPIPDGYALTSVNHKTGSRGVSGVKKDQRAELKRKGHKVSKIPTSKNIHGDKEFIVKLQPPTGAVGLPKRPWMCYDGPTRSFQAYIPNDTAGLPEVYELLQREGVKSHNPMFGWPGYKGYFKAKWEGSSVRIFYDRIVSPQVW
ncbi:hypothetical protein ACHAXR_011369 [Thalassiosira sp. AJA248-18]